MNETGQIFKGTNMMMNFSIVENAWTRIETKQKEDLIEMDHHQR